MARQRSRRSSLAPWRPSTVVPQQSRARIAGTGGGLDEAIKAYGDSLAIRKRLAGADAVKAEWQQAPSLSCERIGNVLVAQDRLDEALKPIATT
jgi:hypothetical protein